jgi:hypothetical protein
VVVFFQQSIQRQKTAPKKSASLFDELASALNLESPSSFDRPDSGLFDGQLDPESSFRESLFEELDDTNGFSPSSKPVSCSNRFSAQRNGHITGKSQQRLQEETLSTKLSVEWPPEESPPAPPMREEPKHSVTWSTNVIPPLTETNANSTSTFETSLPHFQFQNSFISYNNSLIGYHNGQWINRVQLRKRFVSFSKYTKYPLIVDPIV